MTNSIASKYSVELRTPEGLLLADLSGRAGSGNGQSSGRVITQSRNEADDISWFLDLNEFERYCALKDVNPRALIVNGQTECRIKRGGTYISGGQIDYTNVDVGINNQSVEVHAAGFLNLFKDRYTTASRVFTATEGSMIATTLISESQALTNGNFGITMGRQATIGPHDRTYARSNIMTALQDLANTLNLDFEFTAEKVFNTWYPLGSIRPEIIFEYPGNILEPQLSSDATSLQNEIIALGTGTTDDTIVTVVVDDEGAQLTNKLRQNVIQTNGTDNSDNGVTDAANAQLSTYASPIEMPNILVDGNVFPFFTDYGVGDWVRVKFGGDYKMINHINALYRVEKRILTIDDNDNEQVQLYLSA